MFTVEEIKAAHSKVKSGADFPAYIQEIKKMGVTYYEAFVSDGRIYYHSANNPIVKVPEKYSTLAIADTVDIEKFKAELFAHQQGKTDYLTFIRMCAATGIEKWEICIDKMTCVYFDKSGKEIVSEQIPQ